MPCRPSLEESGWAGPCPASHPMFSKRAPWGEGAPSFLVRDHRPGQLLGKQTTLDFCLRQAGSIERRKGWAAMAEGGGKGSRARVYGGTCWGENETEKAKTHQGHKANPALIFWVAPECHDQETPHSLGSWLQGLTPKRCFSICPPCPSMGREEEGTLEKTSPTHSSWAPTVSHSTTTSPNCVPLTVMRPDR